MGAETGAMGRVRVTKSLERQAEELACVLRAGVSVAKGCQQERNVNRADL